MKKNNTVDFEFLILGTDPNAYYMARCVHEAYHKKPYVVGKMPLPFTYYSNIMHVSYCPLMWDEEAFMKLLLDFAEEHKGKNFLIATNETYGEFISKNAEKLREYYYFNYPTKEIIGTFTNKEKFYQTYQESSLKFPKTIYLKDKEEIKIPKDIQFPVIVKPANVVIYNHLSFPGKNKIYKIDNLEKLEQTISIIREGGYHDRLIIQEFIPGGDDHLFDAVIYANQDGEVELMTFAQIGLQERTTQMVGNAAVLINGFNTTEGDVQEQVQILKDFMESIHYHGFAEVDMKYDPRDNTFKVLEINARQGRCSYYLAMMGKNLVQVLVDDCVYHKRNDFLLLDQEVLLSFVPKGVVKKYVSNEKFKSEALRLWNRRVNPMDYPKDYSLKRFLMLRKRGFRYYQEYKNSYWRE